MTGMLSFRSTETAGAVVCVAFTTWAILTTMRTMRNSIHGAIFVGTCLTGVIYYSIQLANLYHGFSRPISQSVRCTHAANWYHYTLRFLVGFDLFHNLFYSTEFRKRFSSVSTTHRNLLLTVLIAIAWIFTIVMANTFHFMSSPIDNMRDIALILIPPLAMLAGYVSVLRKNFMSWPRCVRHCSLVVAAISVRGLLISQTDWDSPDLPITQLSMACGAMRVGVVAAFATALITQFVDIQTLDAQQVK